MGYNYEDYYDDLDTLTDEYVEKAKECLKENIKEDIKHYECKKKLLMDLQEKLAEKEIELQKRENAFKDNKKQIIVDWIKDFGLDLQIGQEVYIIKKSNKGIECPTCQNEKKVKIKIKDKEFKIQCPDCQGWGKNIPIYEIVKRYVKKIVVSFEIRQRNYWNKEIDINALPEEGSLYVKGVYLVDDRDNSDYNSYQRKNIYLTKGEAEKELEEIKRSENNGNKK